MLAVLQKYLCDGELALHLNLQSARLATYDLAREEDGFWKLGPHGPVTARQWQRRQEGQRQGKSDKSAEPEECF